MKKDIKVPLETSNLETFFPPPWNVSEHPEKTEGWIEFQKAMRASPNYYLYDILKKMSDELESRMLGF